MVLKIGTFGDDTLDGSAQNDTLQGSFGDDVLNGLAGNDNLFGGPGDDELYGGQGDDLLHMGPGTDIFDGGIGTDTVAFDTDLDVSFDDEDNVAWYDYGSTQILNVENVVTRGGDDYVKFSTVGVEDNVATTGDGNDTAYLGAGNDVANLGAGDDRAFGMDGSDTLNGGGGGDELNGGAGADTLRGGGGADELLGSTGVDLLEGGAAADQFIFGEGDSGVGAGSRDVIADFSKAQNDRIDLSAFGGLEFVGTGTFDAPDQVRFVHSGGDTLVRVNTVGNGGAELEIQLDGVINLAASDFIL